MQIGPSPQALEIIEREMKERTGSLILSDCGLTEMPKMIFEMDWLTELVITNGYETEGQTYQSTKMMGEPNYLSEIPEEIVRLKDLKKLRIGGAGTSPWGITDIDMLVNLKELEELDLSLNQISISKILSELKKLRVLKLNNNQIKAIQIMEELQQLEILELKGNYLTEPNLSILVHSHRLKVLNLEQNKILIFNVPLELTLKELNLNDNQLSALNFLENITGLESLYLSRNKISDLKPLHKLETLKILDLSSNDIDNVDVLSSLPKLESLGLSHNRIQHVDKLTKLSHLKTLFIGYNNILSVEPLCQMPGLVEIFLDRNKIMDCPADVWQSNDIRQIRAFFDSQKREVSKKQKQQKEQQSQKGKTSRTFKAIEEAPAKEAPEELTPEEVPASEIEDIKLIFVGNSGSGKTQLSKFFETGKLDKTRETTHGIRLKRWLLQGKASPAFKPLKDKIAANIWDFGGQEYYHGTFRLFLSNYAVYILLWEHDTNKNDILSTEVRADENENLQHYHYKYWLDNIRHYAPASPILILQNKIDKDGRHRVDTRWIQDYKIFGDHYISLHEAAGKKDQQYIWSFDLFCNDLSHCMKQIVETEAQTKQKSPAWLKIRDAVVEAAKTGKKNSKNPFTAHLNSGRYIEITDFEKACKKIEATLTPDEIHTLPRWLHSCGLVIYFGDDQQLSDKVYLDPIWVTEGIYKILSDTVRKNKGVFSKSDMETRKGFSKDTMLALMQEMEIIFEKSDEPGKFVAPQYLPETHAIEDLYAIAAKGLQQKAYFVRLPLYFFRKVLQRMIFFYGMSSNVDARYYWKKGILFEKKGTRVMFKGIMPEKESEYGVFLIGAEPIGQYREIQKEVFHIIAEILDGNDLGSIAFQGSGTLAKPSRLQNIENALADIHLRPDNWTEDYKKEEIPRWLMHMEVSVDGENFVNYLKLCHANRNEEVFIHSEQGEQLRIHDFELLLDKKSQRPLKVFFSYSHKDTEIMDKLAVHLTPLKLMEKIEIWTDKAIQPGEEWDKVIKENLQNSDIILLLVSADFVASTYIWDKEIKLALQRLESSPNTKFKVIPIYLRPMDFKGLFFADMEMIPKDAGSNLKPISLWENIDEAFQEVAQRIRAVITEVE